MNGNDATLGTASNPWLKQQSFCFKKPVHQLASSEYYLDANPQKPESEFYDIQEYDLLYVLKQQTATHTATAKLTMWDYCKIRIDKDFQIYFHKC